MALKDFRMITTIPVSDLDRATQFYGDTLGLHQLTELLPDVVMEAGEGTQIALYVSQMDVEGARGTATRLVWEVDDLDAESAELRDKGIRFEEFDLPNFRTIAGRLTDRFGTTAWFLDPDRNILAIHQGFARSEEGGEEEAPAEEEVPPESEEAEEA